MTGNAPVRNTPVRSEFYGQSAQEVFDAYWAWLRPTRARYVGAAVAVGAAAVLALWLADSWALYVMGLAAVVAIAVACQAVVNRRFAALTAILSTDCDVEKWRGVLERILDHGGVRRRRTRELYAIYVSIADCEEMRYEDALARLADVRVPRRGALALMFHQARAVYARELGDEETCAADVASVRELCDGLRRGSAQRRTAERTLCDLELGLKDPAAWDERDEALARERLAAPQTHRERVAWALRLAAFELVRGRDDEARALLEDGSLEPMTPRMRHRREALLAA